MTDATPFDRTGAPGAGNNAGRSQSNIETFLFETLCYVLIEKGVLSRNDALDIIQTVATVKIGADGSDRTRESRVEIDYLRRMFDSFEAMDDRPDAAYTPEGNVQWLRPPLQSGKPEFPNEGE